MYSLAVFFTISNFLSLLRVPLALVFLNETAMYRCFAIFLAMATDSLDGYLARRFQHITRVGTVLDPLTDKFFVLFAIGIFIHEGRLQPLAAITLMARDISLLLFGLYLTLKGRWSTFYFRSIWCGKITTALQFIALLGLTFQRSLPDYFFGIFIVLAVCAWLELYLTQAHPQNS